MKADLLQAMALCAHGNAYLRSGDERPIELLGTGPFATTKELEFRRWGSASSPQLVADSVAPWMRRIQGEGVTSLRLFTSSIPMDPREFITINWGPVTDGDRGVELWTPFWRIRLNTPNDPKPHVISYTGVRLSRWALPAPAQMDEAQSGLSETLDHTIVVLNEMGHSHLAIPLTHCKSLADLRDSNLRSFKDAFPHKIDPEKKILAAEALRIAQTLTATSWLDLLHQVAEPAFADVESLWNAVLKALEVSVG